MYIGKKFQEFNKGTIEEKKRKKAKLGFEVGSFDKQLP